MAMSKLKRVKAGGNSGILPELLLYYGGADLSDRLLMLMQDIWKIGAAFKDWREAEVVPIPKKGDLKICDNLIC